MQKSTHHGAISDTPAPMTSGDVASATARLSDFSLTGEQRVDRPFGMTVADIRDALADAVGDDTGSAPTRPHGAPVIRDLDIPATWLDQRPAAWNAFGEDPQN